MPRTPHPAIRRFDNEWKAAQRLDIAHRYYIYLVSNVVSNRPRVEKLENPSRLIRSKTLSLEPIRYRLDLREQE